MATEIQIHAKQVRVNSSLLSLHHLTRLRAATERKELTFPQRSLETNQIFSVRSVSKYKSREKNMREDITFGSSSAPANELLGRINLTFAAN